MKILLVEDDKNLCCAIKAQLSREGFLIDAFYDGEEAFLYALDPENQYDLAVIDRMLPVIDGLSIIKAMRQKGIQIPVIVITGMSELDDKIEGLDSGADDYLVKPFHIRELSARIRALNRRPCRTKENTSLNYGDLSLTLSDKRLHCLGKSLLLTPKEFQLFALFLDSPGTILSRSHLMAKGWECGADIEPGNVDNYIYFLRKRLKSLKSRCQIRSVYGSGYILEAPHD
ncbi:MAG: response regulator transcription factor [Coprococcus sp.]|nr:response regulator transcription factor [Coprococcus sp.]